MISHYLAPLPSTATFGLIRTNDILNANSNVYKCEVNRILRKYSHEIIVCNKSTDLQNYDAIAVQDFTDLLKLAVNLNKHIKCWKTEQHAEFSVVVDNEVYLYSIYYDGNESFSIIEGEIHEAEETASVIDRVF